MWERQSDDPTCEFERTVGMMRVDIPHVGSFSLFDCASQKQFHKTHGLFFSVLNSLRGQTTMYTIAIELIIPQTLLTPTKLLK